ncbi:MAG: MogA/MoaB family molybdenum cofactor biosynthesis protein [Thermodesulfobacteriota bacterium]
MSTEAEYTCAVLTVSDRGSRHERQDTSGPALRLLLERQGLKTVSSAIVPDEADDIQKVIIDWIDRQHIDLVITTGGTGLSPRDITPEATRPILDLEIPGISEAMRMAGLSKTVNAILSRGLAGVRKKSIIINLPGSEKAAIENLETVIKALPHALYKLKGGQDDCGG